MCDVKILKLIKTITIVLDALVHYNEFAVKQEKKQKLEEKFFSKKYPLVGVDLQKVEEQGKDENTRRLLSYREMVEKKDKKTSLLVHLLHTVYNCTAHQMPMMHHFTRGKKFSLKIDYM